MSCISYRGDKLLKSRRNRRVVYTCDFEVATSARQKLQWVAATKIASVNGPLHNTAKLGSRDSCIKLTGKSYIVNANSRFPYSVIGVHPGAFSTRSLQLQEQQKKKFNERILFACNVLSLKAGFHWRRSRSRSRKSASHLVKIENRSRKRSHKLDRVGRIRTVPFSSDSAYDSDAYDPWKLDCRIRKQKRKNQPITMPVLRQLIGLFFGFRLRLRQSSFH